MVQGDALNRSRIATVVAIPLTQSEYMMKHIPNARLLRFDAPHNLMLSIPAGLPERILGFLREHRRTS